MEKKTRSVQEATLSSTKTSLLPVHKPKQAASSFEVVLSKETRIEEAFEHIAVQCLLQLQENEDGISPVYHAESLHQFRIALRRLRLVSLLFKKVIVVPTELTTEIKWLITSLGPARDYDVLLMETLPRLAEIVPRKINLHDILIAAKNLAHKEHRTAASAIGSQRYTLFVLNFLLWIHTRGWRDALTADQKKTLNKNITAFCHDKIAKRHRQLHKLSSSIEVGNIAMLHRTRIAAKYARYTTEFFSALLSPKRTRPYLKTIAAIQTQLGWLNDVAHADDMLKALLDANEDVVYSASLMREYLVSMISSESKQSYRLLKNIAAIESPC